MYCEESRLRAFVLANGEPLESRYHLFTASLYKSKWAANQRTIPVSSLGLDATVVASRERGVEITVPRHNNSVLIGF